MSSTYNRASNLRDPPGGVVVIDYSGGDQVITVPMIRVWIGVAGHLKVDMLDGTTGTFSNMPVGMWDMRAIKIYQTGSTAAGNILY